MGKAAAQIDLFASDESHFITIAEFYNQEKLSRHIKRLERRYNVTDRCEEFANLVNTATSKVQPFHRWVRYREGYAGDLVKSLIEESEISPEHDYLIDPMCGSGSSLVAAKEAGFASLGLDVNPFSIELSNCKVTTPTPEAIQAINRFLRRLSDEDSSANLNSESIEECRKYFSPEAFDGVLAILTGIKRVKNPIAHKILKVACLSVLEDCSNRKRDGNGLATRPSRVKDVRAFFANQVQTMLSDFDKGLYSRKPAQAYDISALQLDSACARFEKKYKSYSAGAVIFSPPYANSFDYFESYKMELLMGEYYTPWKLAEQRKRLVRNYRIGYGKELLCDIKLVEMLCAEIWNEIPVKESETGVKDGRTRLVPNMLRGYFEDMKQVLFQCYNVLRDKGRMFVVVDQSSYVGVIIPADLVLAEIGEQLGFHNINIIKCRRAFTSGQQMKRYPYLKDSLRESIVVFEK